MAKLEGIKDDGRLYRVVRHDSSYIDFVCVIPVAPGAKPERFRGDPRDYESPIDFVSQAMPMDVQAL